MHKNIAGSKTRFYNIQTTKPFKLVTWSKKLEANQLMTELCKTGSNY